MRVEVWVCVCVSRYRPPPHRNVFGSLSPAAVKTVRSIMIDLVLATDLAVSFDLIGRFNVSLRTDKLVPAPTPEGPCVCTCVCAYRRGRTSACACVGVIGDSMIRVCGCVLISVRLCMCHEVASP